MSSTIGQQTVLGLTETYISMSNSSWARNVLLPSSWNKIRIGIRGWWDDAGGSLSGEPRFALGLCSNTTNLVGDAITDYFVGVVSNASSWNYSPPAYSIYYQIAVVPAYKTGSFLVSGSNITSDARVSTTGSKSSAFYVDITKGSPNYTFNIYNVIGGIPANLAKNTFMEHGFTKN